MKKSLLRVIQLVACVAIGSSAVLLTAPRAEAAGPDCANTVCTIDIPSLDVSCTFQSNGSCKLESATKCDPGSCNPI